MSQPDPTWKLYLSGDVLDGRKEELASVADELNALGYDVWSPSVLSDDDALMLRRERLSRVVECHAIIMVPGWEKSQDSRLEVAVARSVNMPVYLYHGDRLLDFTNRVHVRIHVDATRVKK